MMRTRQLANYIVIGFAIISFVYWLISDALSVWASTANQLLVGITYIFLSPWYVIVLAYMWIEFPEHKVRAVLAALLVIIAIELASLPHMLLISGQLPTETTSQFFLEVAMAKSIPYMNQLGIIGTFLLYWFLANLCIVAAHDLVADRTFISLVSDELRKMRHEQ